MAAEHLVNLYVVEGLSTGQCAARLGVEQQLVLRELVALGIDVRLGVSDLLSPPLLRRRYVDEGATTVDIAKETGFTPATVARALDKARIPAQRGGATLTKRVAKLATLTKEYLEREYVQNDRSATSIATEIGVGGNDVLDALRRSGMTVRPARGGPRQHKALKSTLSPEYLRSEFLEKGRSAEELAADLGTTKYTLIKYLRKHGLIANKKGP